MSRVREAIGGSAVLAASADYVADIRQLVQSVYGKLFDTFRLYREPSPDPIGVRA